MKLFTENDALVALRRIAQEKGKERATLLERMLRLETNHFRSLQYQQTGSAGMEDGAWGATVKPYFPNGYQTVFFRDNHPQERGTNKPLAFIVWNSVYDFCRFLSDYIDRHQGNYARWNSTIAARQATYRNKIASVIPRFDFVEEAIETFNQLEPVKKKS